MDSASGTASPLVLTWASGQWPLGPGLTSDSADAVRVVLRNDLPAGVQVPGTCRGCRSDLPCLDKRPGFTGPTANRSARPSWSAARSMPSAA